MSDISKSGQSSSIAVGTPMGLLLLLTYTTQQSSSGITYSNQSKNSASFSNTSKNTSTITNATKHSAIISNITKS
jgi:hypothetical protein